MIAYFPLSVNLNSFPFSRFFRASYYKSYNCKFPFILNCRICGVFVASGRSQGVFPKKALCHLHGNFLKIRGLFFKLSEFFLFPTLPAIYIRISIISFYKELSTLSTDFSTIANSLLHNHFLYNLQLFTISVTEFPHGLEFDF